MHSKGSIDETMALAARTVMYGLLQRVFAEVPDEALHEMEGSEVTGQALDVYRSLAAHFGMPDEESAFSPKGKPSALEGKNASLPLSLEGEFNRLFVGVGKPAVSVWESVYRTGDSSLFQPNTLEVRRCYEAFGLQSRDYPRVADDHLAIELAFLRELAIRTIGIESDRKQALLCAQRDFLLHHLSAWVDAFADNVAKADRAGYFSHYARLLKAFVKIDTHVLSTLCEPA